MTAEIKGISSMATRPILADLASAYEQRTGYRVAIEAMGGVDAARAVRAGRSADVIVLAAKVMEQLQAQGHLVPGSTADFARSGIAMAVPSDASPPSAKDEESVKEAILQASKIAYSSGPSGAHLMQLWTQWGIAEIVAQRAKQVPPGIPVGSFIASGEADLGFQQLSELLDVPGIDIVGPLPPEIQAITVFSAGVCSASSQHDAAHALVAYLTSGETAAAKRRHGMEPA